jgi:hypothetical protein
VADQWGLTAMPLARMNIVHTAIAVLVSRLTEDMMLSTLWPVLVLRSIYFPARISFFKVLKLWCQN